MTSAIMAFFGPLLDLPDLVIEASPYTHLPQLPQDSPQAAPYLILSLIALALLAVGFAGIRRRDVPSA